MNLKCYFNSGITLQRRGTKSNATTAKKGAGKSYEACFRAKKSRAGSSWS